MIVSFQSEWYNLDTFTHPGGQCWFEDLKHGQDVTLAVAAHHDMDRVKAILQRYKIEDPGPTTTTHPQRPPSTGTPNLDSYASYRIPCEK